MICWLRPLRLALPAKEQGWSTSVTETLWKRLELNNDSRRTVTARVRRYTKAVLPLDEDFLMNLLSSSLFVLGTCCPRSVRSEMQWMTWPSRSIDDPVIVITRLKHCFDNDPERSVDLHRDMLVKYRLKSWQRFVVLYQNSNDLAIGSNRKKT